MAICYLETKPSHEGFTLPREPHPLHPPATFGTDTDLYAGLSSLRTAASKFFCLTFNQLCFGKFLRALIVAPIHLGDHASQSSTEGNKQLLQEIKRPSRAKAFR